MIEDRPVERAEHAVREMAVEEGELEDTLALGAGLIDMAGKLDARFGQGAGLVGAEDVHGAEIVDRGEPLHDDLALGEALGAARQRHRDDRRQKLRRQPHGERQREHQRLEERAVEEDVGDEDEEHHEDGQPQHEHAELVDTQLECGRGRRLVEGTGDVAEPRRLAGDADHRPRASRGDQGREEDRIAGRACPLSLVSEIGWHASRPDRIRR